jgi:hypothetical protein
LRGVEGAGGDHLPHDASNGGEVVDAGIGVEVQGTSLEREVRIVITEDGDDAAHRGVTDRYEEANLGLGADAVWGSRRQRSLRVYGAEGSIGVGGGSFRGRLGAAVDEQ